MTSAIEKELKKDHKKIKDLMNKIESILDGKYEADKYKLFLQLNEELVSHSKAEDKAYYNKLVNYEKTKDIVKEGKEEHAIIANLLKQMTTLDSESDKWKAKFTVLKELVEHHVKDEELDMFKKSEKILDQGQGEQIKEDYLDEKERVMAGF